MKIHSQLTKAPLKELRQKNEQSKIVQGNPCPNSNKVLDKAHVLVPIQNYSTMPYNIVDHLHKMQVTLPIMEVMKIPPQKENLFKSLEYENSKEK